MDIKSIERGRSNREEGQDNNDDDDDTLHTSVGVVSCWHQPLEHIELIRIAMKN